MTDPLRRPPRTAPTGSPFGRFVAARLDREAYLGFHLTVGIVGAALFVWLFGALLDAVLDNRTLVQWDVATAAAIHERVTAGGLRAFDAITQVGSPAAMAVLCLAGAILLRRQRTTLVAWLAAFAGGMLLDQLLKTVVHRARPVYGAAYLHGASYSFPSGHAMGSAVGYGMLAYALSLHWHPVRGRRALLYAAAALVVALVGVSRVYLGVHYPSDVAGGWAAGVAWAVVCATGAGIARRRASVAGSATITAR